MRWFTSVGVAFGVAAPLLVVAAAEAFAQIGPPPPPPPPAYIPPPPAGAIEVINDTAGQVEVFLSSPSGDTAAIPIDPNQIAVLYGHQGDADSLSADGGAGGPALFHITGPSFTVSASPFIWRVSGP